MLVALLIYAANTGIPSFETLENPDYKLATEIYDINHQVFGTYYVENRIPVAYNDLNPFIKKHLCSQKIVAFTNIRE